MSFARAYPPDSAMLCPGHCESGSGACTTTANPADFVVIAGSHNGGCAHSLSIWRWGPIVLIFVRRTFIYVRSTVAELIEPTSWRSPDDGGEGPAERSLVREATFQSDLRKRHSRPLHEGLSSLHTALDHVTMHRHTKGPFERSREMACREATLTGESRQPQLRVQPIFNQLRKSPYLPGGQPSDMRRGQRPNVAIGRGHVTAEHENEVVEHQVAHAHSIPQPWQDEIGEPKQDLISRSLRARHRSHSSQIVLVRKGVQCRPRKVEVNIVEGAVAKGNRI